MIRILVVLAVAFVGIALLLDDSWSAGLALLVLGAAIANGARHGVWLSLYIDEPDGGSSDSDDWDGDAGSDDD